VSAATTVGGWTGERFAHEAFVYDRADEALERVVPFVEEGLERGEPTIVVASPLVGEALTRRLGPAVDELAVFADSAGFWQGSGQATLAAYHESMEPLLEADRPWRLVGEPTWLTAPGGEAWSRFEAVANDAFAGYPYYSLCLHDSTRIPPRLVENQLRAHPLVWDGADVVPSPHYWTTEDFLRSGEPAWVPAPAQRGRVDVTDCASARRFVYAQLDRGTGGRAEDAGRADDVALAVNELVSNALKAAGAAELSTWSENGTRVWQVADHGSGFHAASAGYAPPPLDLVGGRGLWLARSLADDLRVRPDGPGTVVRLLFTRPEARPETRPEASARAATGG
jgi:anti-sigma regulatory factor (Ser/Thr protein kinase)